VLLGFFVFTLGSVVSSFYLSFTTWDMNEAPRWVGAANYQELFDSELFWKVLGNTFYYVLLFVPLSIATSLGLALLIKEKVKGIAIFRATFFLPVVTSMVAAALIWSWLYNSDIGLLNYLLSLVGIDGPRWLEDPRWAMSALAIMGVWKTAGYNMMIFLAGLVGISHEYYDAATLDGVSRSRQFLRITLPLLSPILFFVTITTTISAFQIFEQTYVLTKGGPGNATLTLSYYIWESAFKFFNVGSASAMAYLLFVILLTITALQFVVRKKWVHDLR
jgi:multiple sugar transport system permease protein